MTSYSDAALSLPMPACISAICNQSTRVSGCMPRTCSTAVETSSTSGSASRRGLCSRREVTSESSRRSSFLFGLKRAFFLLLLTHAIKLKLCASACQGQDDHQREGSFILAPP